MKVSKRGFNFKTIDGIPSSAKHSGKTAAKEQKQGLAMNFDVTNTRNTKNSKK